MDYTVNIFLSIHHEIAYCGAILIAGSRAVSNVYIVTRSPEARANVVAGSVKVTRRAVGARTMHSFGTGLISN